LTTSEAEKAQILTQDEQAPNRKGEDVPLQTRHQSGLAGIPSAKLLRLQAEGRQASRDALGRYLPEHEKENIPPETPAFRARCRIWMTNKGWKWLRKIAASPGRDQLDALKFIAEQGYGKATTGLVVEGDLPIRVGLLFLGDRGTLAAAQPQGAIAAEQRSGRAALLPNSAAEEDEDKKCLTMPACPRELQEPCQPGPEPGGNESQDSCQIVEWIPPPPQNKNGGSIVEGNHFHNKPIQGFLTRGQQQQEAE